MVTSERHISGCKRSIYKWSSLQESTTHLLKNRHFPLRAPNSMLGHRGPQGSRPSQSNISDTTTPKHAVAPAYVSSKYKAVWLPYEGDSEDEYEDGVKKKKSTQTGPRRRKKPSIRLPIILSKKFWFFVLNNLYYFINLVTFQSFIITKIGHARIENYEIKLRLVG